MVPFSPAAELGNNRHSYLQYFTESPQVVSKNVSKKISDAYVCGDHLVRIASLSLHVALHARHFIRSTTSIVQMLELLCRHG